MPDEGSACVWHDLVYSFSSSRLSNIDPWTDDELKESLEMNSLSIGAIVEVMCNCAVPKGRYDKAFGNIGAPHSALVINYNPDGQR